MTVYSSLDEVLATVDTDTIGNYLQELLEGDYRIVLSKDGYADLSTTVSVLANALTSNAYIMLTEEECRQSASLKGVVISALDSAAIEGATVALLNGFDHPSYQDPDAIAGSSHTTTGADGGFSMENGISAGYYTVVTSKDNYSTYHHNETIKPGENDLQISMSPLIRNQGVYRIVLEWGSSPRDLDSHITSRGNDNYHVYFSNRSSGDGKAVLDRDVTSGYGPETITLEISEGNSYIYSIRNYTDGGASQGSSAAWNLANSGAKVTVYGEEGIIFSGDVPTHEQGVTWEVFRIENGRLIVTNRMCFEHPSNLPQTTAVGGGLGRQAAPAFLEEEKEKVPSTVPQNGVQALGNTAVMAENAGEEETGIEESKEEAAESEESGNAGEGSEGTEKEESGNIGENIDSAIENTEEPKEDADSKDPEDISVPADGEEVLNPDEKVPEEEKEPGETEVPEEAEEPGETEVPEEAEVSGEAEAPEASGEAEVSEEAEVSGEAEPSEEIEASEEATVSAEEAASLEESN